MERKKSVKADLEWRKPTFFQVGLVVALLLVLVSFELVGSREKKIGGFGGDIEIPPDIVIIPTKHDEIKPPPPPAPTAPIFEMVDNTVDLPDFIVDADPNSDIPYEEVVYVPYVEPVIEAEDAPLIFVEIYPEYPGGDDARIKFLSENLIYPKIAREIGLEGRVFVRFVVEKDGRLTNFEIARSVAPVLDNEALRVVKLMPNWTPGKQRNKTVRVQYQIPITFSLQ